VRSATYANQFTSSTKENPGFGFTKSAYWHGLRWKMHEALADHLLTYLWH
jgi:hypothetical protein